MLQLSLLFLPGAQTSHFNHSVLPNVYLAAPLSEPWLRKLASSPQNLFWPVNHELLEPHHDHDHDC